MSDEQTPTPDGEDTSVAATGGTEEQVNWEQKAREYEERYLGGVQEFTRKSQRLSEMEQALQGLHADDPDTRQQAAQILGIELADDEDDSLLGDPNLELQTRLARIEAAFSQDAQAREAQQVEQRDLEVIGTGLRDIQSSLGRDLTPEEIGLLGDAAWSNRDEHGLPNIAHVGQMYAQALTANAPTPKRPRAPFVSAAGSQADNSVRLDDPNLSRQERQELMLQALQATEL